MRVGPRDAQRLLLLHNGALGDCVLALHFAVAAKTALRAKHLAVVARSPIARWAARRGLIAAGLLLDDVGAHRWYADGPVTDKDPFLCGFDAIVSLLGGPEDPVTTRLTQTSGRRVFAVDPKPATDGPASKTHIVRQWASRLGEAGIAPSIPDQGTIRLDPPRDRRDWREGLVLIHPGSGGRRKCCPLEPLERVVADLQTKGRNVAWMIGPDEVERDGLSLKRRLEASAEVVFEESVEEAADVIASAGTFIGNDAGMTHVAALAGVRTIALFGPTDSRVWHPLGPNCQTGRWPDNGHSMAWLLDESDPATGEGEAPAERPAVTFGVRTTRLEAPRL